jgi:hypothetical protein
MIIDTQKLFDGDIEGIEDEKSDHQNLLDDPLLEPYH